MRHRHSLSGVQEKLLVFVQMCYPRLLAQTGYVKGRYIGESIRIITDMMSITKKKNIPGLAVFLDFEKAFDSVIIIPTLFIQYNERERYQRLSLYEGIRPDVTDLESILTREENRSTRRKTLGVRLRSTETQPT